MYFSGIADEAGQSIDTQIRAHQELGWKHLGLRNVDGLNAADLCDEVFEVVAEKILSAGMEVSDFVSQLCHWSRPIIQHPDIDIEEFKRACPRMQLLGCKYIRTMSYSNAGWPEDEWRIEAVKRLSQLAALAEDAGVVLVLENCAGWTGQGPEQTIEVFESVGSESFKLLWDTANPVIANHNPWHFYTEVREHIACVHVKDVERASGRKIRYTFPGEGDAMIKDVLSDLKSRGYNGGVSIEPHLGGIIPEGDKTCPEGDGYNQYLKYGKSLMELVDEIKSN